MGELYRQFLPAGRGNDPLGQPSPMPGEDVSQPGGFFLPLDLEAGVAQGRLDRAGRSLYAMPLVGEQVYVLGRPADHAMRQQRVPALRLLRSSITSSPPPVSVAPSAGPPAATAMPPNRKHGVPIHPAPPGRSRTAEAADD